MTAGAITKGFAKVKKHYSSLVDGFKIVAILIFIFGGAGVIFAFLSPYGIGLAIALTVSTIVTSLFLNGIAAIIDLLATIEVNTRTTAAYFEKRIQPKQAE